MNVSEILSKIANFEWSKNEEKINKNGILEVRIMGKFSEFK